jgi:hypothetical protein
VPSMITIAPAGDHAGCIEARVGDCICAPHDDGLSALPLPFDWQACIVAGDRTLR